MVAPINPVNYELFCPNCSANGMRKTEKDKTAGGKARHTCISCRHRTTTPLYSKPQILPKTKLTEIKRNKFFVITSAINDTDIVRAAHETFRQAAKANGGPYLIIPTVYKNPDLYHEGRRALFTWPEEILPHICNANVDLNKSLTIKGETTITHTAINPLSGMNSSGDVRSEIYGHAQVAMEMVATPKSELPKMLHTTGTISQPQYGKSKTAQKAAFHHSLSALIVEVEGDKFWTRELHFNGEGAYDLDRYYTPEGYTDGHEAEGMVYGDVHVQALEPKIRRVVHDDLDGLLKPKKRMMHDVHDQHIGSHHNKGNVIFYLQKAHQKMLSVEDELMLSVEYLDSLDDVHVIESNHHDHLAKWFNGFKVHNDVLNAPFYFDLSALIKADIKKGGDGNAFRVFLEDRCEKPLTFISANDRFQVAGVDCSQHGDKGPNGARGSAKGISKSGYKMMIGHGHSPCIEKGTYQVGVMSPNLDYAKGLSSWMNTHGVIYADGKRALIHIVKGKLSPSMRPGYREKVAKHAAR